MPKHITRAFVGSVFVVLAQVASARAETSGIAGRASLDALIRQNAASSALTYRKLSNPVTIGELRIYARTTGQKSLVEAKLGWVKSIALKGQALAVDPVQVLTLGPLSSELRYFAAQDRAAATDLYASLSKGIPQLQLRDESSLYGKAGTIGSRRYELWLAPGLNRFGP